MAGRDDVQQNTCHTYPRQCVVNLDGFVENVLHQCAFKTVDFILGTESWGPTVAQTACSRIYLLHYVLVLGYLHPSDE